MCTTGLELSTDNIITVEDEARRKREWERRRAEERARIEEGGRRARRDVWPEPSPPEKVYVVTGQGGEYTAHEVWIVRVFGAEETAKAFAELANAWVKAHAQGEDSEQLSWRRYYIHGQSPYDPCMGDGSQVEDYYLDDTEHPDSQVYEVTEVDADSELLSEMLARQAGK